ncbi:unnamed protein product, partial [Allacma fusca]
ACQVPLLDWNRGKYMMTILILINDVHFEESEGFFLQNGGNI